ncbi:MAG: tetratricopeptide repeat protein [Candidatus Altarchaeum sp.]|nr:tetratricopeptide repeat protein [Candidatus Altarchaeum sp.]
MDKNNINKGDNEYNYDKKKRNFFQIIFFAGILVLFFGTYYFVHPYIDKPPEISNAENAALQKENAGNITGAIDEYNNLLNKENSKEKKCIYYTRIAKLYSQSGKTEIAIGYYENATNLAKDKNFTTCMYEAMFWRWYYEKNATCLMKSVEIAENLNDDKKKFYSYSQIANYYLNSQNFTKANDFYNKARVLSNNGDDKTIGYNYIGIGTLYTEWNKYEDALQNLKHAEIYLKKVDDKEGLLNAYMAIAYIYTKNNDTKNAIEYYEKAGKISNITNKFSHSELGIAYAYMMLAQKKSDKKDYNAAIEDANAALNLYVDHHGSEQDIASVQNILCYAYFAAERQLEAKECYNMLKIESLDNDANKFKAYTARASLNEFFGLKYEGIETGIVEDGIGGFKKINMFCQRVLTAIDDYKKAMETGKKTNISDEEIKNINDKISELETKSKECSSS